MQWEKFWYRDFCDDLKVVSLLARGFWIFCLAEMWGRGRKGEISGTMKEFGRICSCSEDEAKKAIQELLQAEICEGVFATKVQDLESFKRGGDGNCDEEVTLINRRLSREQKDSFLHNLRQKAYRERKKGDGEVTEKRRSSDAVEERREKKETTYMSTAELSTPPCPHEKIVGLYHQILPLLPAVKDWNETRRRALQARWKEAEKRQTLAWWEKYFLAVKDTPFLCGENNRGWRANLEWLVQRRNLVKIIEGGFENRGNNRPNVPPSSESLPS
jgi:hypothetical protein